MSPSDLARRFFRILAAKQPEELEAFLHPDVVFAPMMFRDRVYEGRDHVMQGFYEIVFSYPAYRPEASTFRDLDEHTAFVSGRIHFADERGALHDTSAFWVLEFDDETLRSLRGKGSYREAIALYDKHRPGALDAGLQQQP